MKKNTNAWLAPSGTKIPDFIICGAMKSGTSTLHAILNSHPDIFIPEKEVHFFDMDNIVEHPDFNSFTNKQWQKNSVENDRKKYWQWYSDNFSRATANQVVGEDSTTYLASPLAIKRIAAQDKPIKLLIMLRNPTARAYSQYWHMLSSGRASHSFENTLQYNPTSVLNRSLYYSQIVSLLRYIPKEQVKFIIFEEFLQDKSKCLKEVCDFLNVDSDELSQEALGLHANAGLFPKYPRIQWIKNRLHPAGGNGSYGEHFSHHKNNAWLNKLTWTKILNKSHRVINPLVHHKPAKMKLATKMFLNEYFIKELEGLNELLDKNVLSLWFGDSI